MMKISFRQIAIFILCSSLLSACKEKEEDDPQLPACKLISIESSSIIFTYQYDGDVVKSRTATSVSDGRVIKVVSYGYDTNGNLVTVSSPGEVATMTYTNDQITKMEYLGSTSFSTTEYEYSGDRLVKIQNYVPSGTDKAGYTIVEYSGSNAVRAKSFSTTGTTPVFTTEYTYGDQNSAFLALPVAYLKFPRLEDVSIGHNLTKYVSSNGIEINYTSEFNSFGFPVKSTATYNDGAVDIRLYTFECE